MSFACFSFFFFFCFGSCGPSAGTKAPPPDEYPESLPPLLYPPDEYPELLPPLLYPPDAFPKSLVPYPPSLAAGTAFGASGRGRGAAEGSAGLTDLSGPGVDVYLNL